MKTLLLILSLVLTCVSLGAQDTIPLMLVEQAPELPADKIRRVKGEPTPEKLLLMAVYNRIKYARVARENGVTGVVRASFWVNTEGETVIDEIRMLSQEEMEPIKVSSDKLFTITAFGTTSVNGGPQSRAKRPQQTKNAKRLAKAYAALEENVRTALLDLPEWSVGKQAGIPVVTSYERYFVFRLE